MKAEPLLPRLAVCSWSLQPADPRELIEQLQAVGIPRVQLALDPLREAPAVWGEIGALCREASIEIVSGMSACVGEDYTTLETIRATGGVVPEATWNENWTRMETAAGMASQLGLRLVTFHAGFLPHEPDHPAYLKILDRVRRLADLFAAHRMTLALETGQETADTLCRFLSNLRRSNVGVNFDPANLILYGKGDPIEALQTLAPWIRQVHIKDACPTKQPGTWGQEVPVGTGQVDWRAFLAALDRIGFRGDCCIEREAGHQRAVDIRAAREHLDQIRG